jgi:hypothetical protein
MIVISIVDNGGRLSASVRGRDAEKALSIPLGAVNSTEAMREVETVFGLLDWGKGGQPANQASVGLDY